MGEVFVLFRVSLDDMENLDNVKKKIEEKFNPKEIKEESIGFGIKVLKVLIVMEDGEGVSKVEEELSNIEGVSSVDVDDMGRL